MSTIEHKIFRANPLYELVLLDVLSSTERELLAEVGEEADVYGVLRPRAGSGMASRSISPETALLFLTLREPAPLPAYVVRRLGRDLRRTVARLALDGVLEIEHGGRYLSGAQAGELLLGKGPAAGHGRIAELSLAALRYAQELALLPASLVAHRLYLYGCRPVCPALMRRLPDAAAIGAHLGILLGGAANAELEGGWVEVPPTASERAYWRMWQARRSRPATEGRDARYKLYVSADLEAVGPAIEAVAASLAGARGVSAFKVGSDLYGLCRPDKLVVYFECLDDLQEGASRLRERLAGCPAHGVPFTAAVTHDGLLSWGVDPPVASAVAGGMSWRRWVTERLAEYLTLARGGAASELEPWQFALERLQLSGIDTDTWIPASGMWPEALASA